MRNICIACACMFAVLNLPAPAHAIEGYKGRVSTEITLGDAFFRAIDPRHDLPLQPGDFTIPPVTGVVYLGGDKLRMDMNTPVGTVTTLVDAGTHAVYTIDHLKRIAWRARPSKPGSDVPVLNLERMAYDWVRAYELLGAVPGMKVARLGEKKIGGEACHGLSARGDISRLLDADEVQVAPGIPALRKLKGPWNGSFWISKRTGLPMRMSSSFMGVSLSWQIAALESWDVPETMLMVPQGYWVKDAPTS
jgi:hypothetical protein